jgi:hypothetical protein
MFFYFLFQLEENKIFQQKFQKDENYVNIWTLQGKIKRSDALFVTTAIMNTRCKI